MIPSSIALSNYRSFGGPDLTTLELRPITLLFGRNGAGKSSLIRSLPLIADSLMPDRNELDVLNFNGRLEPFDLSFENLRWKGREETDEPGISLGLRWAGDAILQDVEWIVRDADDWTRIVVESMNVHGQDGFSMQWRIKRGEQAERALTYEVMPHSPPSSETSTQSVEFHGLLPRLRAETPMVHELQARLQAFASSVIWLRSLRPAPARYTAWKGAVRWSLRPDGRDAPIVLWGERSDILPEVSKFYEDNLGLELRVEKELRKREVRTFMRNRSRAGLDVDLVDTGEGLSEVLPVLTALAMVRRHKERGGPSILAIEEPGAYLHPDLQRALTERVCEVASKARPCIVLETHSETVLRTVMLNVVRGDLSPEDVAMYWVWQEDNGLSKADRIQISASGKLEGNWPPGTFRQNMKLAADIQDELYDREGK